jgi:diguanylate cyclase (GGDEF)-like protein
MFLDLDNFKNINDTKGHSYGDLLLKQASHRLLGCVRESDTVARWGGDEFVILLESINDARDVVTVVEKIQEAIKPSFEIKNQYFNIGVSIGISLFPDGGDDTEALIKGADTAMYEVKAKERGGYLFFDPSMNERINNRLLVEADLRSALKNEEFELYLQPKLDLQQQRVSSAEALIRWNHPEKGMIYPGDFIDIAEQTGLIWEIGAWVIAEACRIIKSLENSISADFNVAVNLSPLQFQRPEILTLIVNILKEEGVDPKLIELEMTEGLLMEQTDDSIAILSAFSNAGFRISIDDFGTGYSSLAYLRKFPLNHLKIDRSFVKDLPDDMDATSVSEAIINLAHGLRLEIVAEGVETAEQLQFMIDHQCRFVQGYFFAKPMSVPSFITWLKDMDVSEFLGKYQLPKKQYKQL